MNLPSNLLLDAEIAKRRLQETFDPAEEAGANFSEGLGRSRAKSVFQIRHFGKWRGNSRRATSEGLSTCCKVWRNCLQELAATIDKGQQRADPEVTGRSMARSNSLSSRYQYGGFVLEIGLFTVIFFSALLGVWVAAKSAQPVTWMLLWPAPLIVGFTVFNFLRQGFHWRSGVLVLGRRG